MPTKNSSNNKPLRIALLTYSTKPRGSVVHTLELAEALAELGHEPHVFALDKDGKGFYRAVRCQTFAVPASPCEAGIDQLIRQRIGEFVAFFEDFLAVSSEVSLDVEDTRYDVYHAQDCLSANALAELKARGKISCFVRTVHHVEAYKSEYLRDCQEKSIYQSDRCLCVSEVWQQVLKADYGVEAHRVTNGVSRRFSPKLATEPATEPLTERSAAELALAKAMGLDLAAGPIYLTVGGIEPRKNSIRLLRAFGQVRSHFPNAKLIIAGGATLFDYQDYRADFMAIAAAENMLSALILPGVVPDADLPDLYRLADAFVFPSVQEGWGLVVLEAIASGLPVLVSDRAPFTEFLTGAAAQMVNPEDLNAIAHAMMEMVKPEVARSLVERSAPIAERFRWQRSAEMHLELYRSL
ncbi:MAG: MSMEG_0565 family glycosyltransferase [Phormidesmis sp.]